MVKAQLERLGGTQSPLVIIDDFTGAVEEVARIADSLAPFPPVAGNAYPGVRRMISPADEQAYAYVMETCERAAPFVGGGFAPGQAAMGPFCVSAAAHAMRSHAL